VGLFAGALASFTVQPRRCPLAAFTSDPDGAPSMNLYGPAIYPLSEASTMF